MNGLIQGVSYPKGLHCRVALSLALRRHLEDMVNLSFALSGIASELTGFPAKSLTTTRTLIEDRTDKPAATYLLMDVNVHNGRYAAHTPQLDCVRTAYWNEVLDRTTLNPGTCRPSDQPRW
jgi:hypothetical protein